MDNQDTKVEKEWKREREGKGKRGGAFDNGVIWYSVHGQVIIETNLQKDTPPSDKIKDLCSERERK